MTESRRLPLQHAVDYDILLLHARGESASSLASFLQQQLPLIWRDVYLSTSKHEPNLVCFRHGTFEYICDFYSQLEMTGSVAFDQRVADRVIGVFGKSSRVQHKRPLRHTRVELSEELQGTQRDDGHFMAHSIGGCLDVNLFSQERRLNRGWSQPGKLYRGMEKYCYEQEGTFCFSRPIYNDGSNVPHWLEFGVLKDDDSLWVEVFDNF